MQRITTLIVDDEPLGRRRLRQLLATRAEFVVIGEARDGRQAATDIETKRPQLVFLDVQMPDVQGVELAEMANAADHVPFIIFVTAHDQYAARAFEVNAVDYLLKPITIARFHEAASRALQRIRDVSANQWSRFEQLLVQQGTPRLGPGASTPAARLLVPGHRADVVIPLDELDWVSADGSYVQLHAGKRSHLLRESMAALEQRLDAHFVRTHRSAIVNISRVRTLRRDAEGGGTLTLVNGASVPVSRRRLEQVVALLNGGRNF